VAYTDCLVTDLACHQVNLLCDLNCTAVRTKLLEKDLSLKYLCAKTQFNLEFSLRGNLKQKKLSRLNKLNLNTNCCNLYIAIGVSVRVLRFHSLICHLRVTEVELKMNKVHISEQKNSIGPFDVNKSISRTRRLTMEVNHPSPPSP